MTTVARKGDWVRIKNTILKVGERAPQVPEETRAVPLDMWVNGFLVNDQAAVGDQVAVTTLAELRREGTLTDIKPVYRVDYGQTQPELLAIGPELRALLREVRKNG